jgi:T4 RnlA family RNA ligase
VKVIEFIKEKGLQALQAELGISVKEYPEGLIVLNYDQIESPKADVVVRECRGLILDKDLNIVSRSFDRFFNYGEQEATFNPNTAIAYEKIDGSLIKIYNWNNYWYISTRGTAFAESKVNGWDITFKDMVFKALEVDNEDNFQLKANHWFSKEFTYIFEVVGVENRVVTRYQEHALYLLAIRESLTGEYYDNHVPLNRDGFKIKVPNQFKFNSVEECINTATHLPDLQEGYVVYESGVPVCKVKSPAYVAVHHIRGEGLNPKRICELVVINEQDEYLKYFPEDEKFFIPYVSALDNSLDEAQKVFELANQEPSQKEFALKVKDYPWFAFAFQARKSGESIIRKAFNKQERNYKVKYLLGIVGEKE